jgi:GTP-dependent dephospho-CoA kinase
VPSSIQFRPIQSDIPRLKEPFGRLIEGDPDKTMPELERLLKQRHPSKVVAVGDVVSRETQARGIPVSLRIIDHKSLRRPTEEFRLGRQQIYKVRNPPGVITSEAWEAVRRAMNEENVVIVVDGEEDLLTLPCISESPIHALVLYGQPNAGLVVVEVTSQVKAEANAILERMTREESEQS